MAMKEWQNLLYRMYRKMHMTFFGIKPGCFIQDPKNTRLGKGTLLSHGTHIYTRNHNLLDFKILEGPEEVIIGDDCWVGANVVILPGVELGEHTVVGAGSIVTKSFKEGWCVIAGNPAKKVIDIGRDVR